MRVTNVLGCAIVATLILAGCTGARSGSDDVPEWTRKGGGAFKDSGPQVFYGVGMAEPKVKNPELGIESKSLRREAADKRARNELQLVFDTYSAVLMKDYLGSDGELVERAIKTFSSGYLSGGEIVDRYSDQDGNMYSLARLDLETFKDAMETAQELSAEAKAFLRSRSDALFEELSAEELNAR